MNQVAIAKAIFLDGVCAEVNNEAILLSDIQQFKQRLQSKNFTQLFPDINKDSLKDSNSILQFLIEEKLITQKIKKTDRSASSQDIDHYIASIATQYHITEAQLYEQLKLLGTTVEEYRNSIKRLIERKNLIKSEIEPKIELSTQMLKSFYEEHAGAEYKDTQYLLAQILIRGKNATDQKAKKKAEKIWNEAVTTPDNFEIYAKKYSQDPNTANSGGVLGELSYSFLSTELKKVAPHITVGQVGPLIKKGSDYLIIKLLELKEPNFDALSSEQKEALRQQLAMHETQKKFTSWVEAQKAESFIKIKLKK